MAITLTDFAHLGQLYLEDLVLDGNETVPDNWFELVSTARADFQEPPAGASQQERSKASNKMSLQWLPPGSKVFGYSYQFWLPPAYDNEFVSRGAFGQFLWIDRKREFVVAQFSTAIAHDSVEYARMMRAIGDALSDAAGKAQEPSAPF